MDQSRANRKREGLLIGVSRFGVLHATRHSREGMPGLGFEVIYLLVPKA